MQWFIVLSHGKLILVYSTPRKNLWNNNNDKKKQFFNKKKLQFGMPNINKLTNELNWQKMKKKEKKNIYHDSVIRYRIIESHVNIFSFNSIHRIPNNFTIQKLKYPLNPSFFKWPFRITSQPKQNFLFFSRNMESKQTIHVNVTILKQHCLIASIHELHHFWLKIKKKKFSSTKKNLSSVYDFKIPEPLTTTICDSLCLMITVYCLVFRYFLVKSFCENKNTKKKHILACTDLWIFEWIVVL